MSSYVTDFDTLSIGGTSFKADLSSFELTVSAETVDDHSLVDTEESEQVAKVMAKLNLPLMSTISDPERVSDLNLTACTLGTEDLKATYGIESLDLKVAPSRVYAPNAGSRFKLPQNLRRAITGNVTFGVPDTGAFPFGEDMVSATYGDRIKVLSLVLNGVTITTTVLLKNLKLAGEKDGLQLITAELGRRKTGGTATLPSTSTTLLGKIFNAYRTALAVVAKNSATGKTFTSNMVFDSLDLSIREGQIVLATYSFENYGAFTIA